jgi:hypothetical protein
MSYVHTIYMLLWFCLRLHLGKETPYALSWGVFAEALSGSDCYDWVLTSVFGLGIAQQLNF